MRVVIFVGWLVSVFAYGATPAQADESDGPRILSEDRFALRRVVSIEIPRRVSEIELARIANAIKTRDRNSYERTIINFYLPRMMLGAGSWATAVFSPKLDLTINGLRLAEARNFLDQAKKDERDVIGAWLTASPATLGKVTIYRDDDRKFAEWTLRNGFKNVNEVIETHTWSGRRFDFRPKTEVYFLINHAGQLELRDDRGLVATAERIWPNIARPLAPFPQAVLQWPVGRTAAEAVAHRDSPSELTASTEHSPIRTSPSDGRYVNTPVKHSTVDAPPSRNGEQASLPSNSKPNAHSHAKQKPMTSNDHMMAQLLQ